MNHFEWTQLTKAIGLVDTGQVEEGAEIIRTLLAIKLSNDRERNWNKWDKTRETGSSTS